jgi:RimJ/RimL family protein N-acetyltransferase
MHHGSMEVPIPTLETARLRLRAFGEADTDAYFRLLQDPDVTRYIGDRAVPSREDVWRAIAGSLGHWILRGHGQWAVEERDTGDLVGRAGIINPEGWPGPELGYLLGRAHWGRGYATEASGVAMNWGFEHHPFEELISLIDPENTASVAVATRLGETLQRETELRGHRVLVYAVARAEWESSRTSR